MSARTTTPAESLSHAIMAACGLDPSTTQGFTFSHHVGTMPVLMVTVVPNVDVDGHPLPPVEWVPKR